MNTARIGTAIQGLAASELAYQNAWPYAMERYSMRALSGSKNPDKAGDAIIAHNTLYLNGAFDFVQTEHHGPNQVAGVAAKKVGFMNVTNNIVVCRNSTYSAFSV